MAIERHDLPPFGLTVIDGGRDWRADEAHIETIAFLDECEAAAVAIVDAIAGLPVPSAYAINEAGRLAHRARLAKAEILGLIGPEPTAA